MRLSEHIYRTTSSIRGPLLLAEHVSAARIGEVVRIVYPGGEVAEGEILKIDGEAVLIQVFGETRGLDLAATLVFTDAVKKAPLSTDVIGRVFNGSFLPIDGAYVYPRNMGADQRGSHQPDGTGTAGGVYRNRHDRHRRSQYTG